MLPKINRIPSPEISPILREGKRNRGKHIDFVYKPTPFTPRFAIIVSTKIDKRAVVRNRMKRLIREAIQKEIPSLIQPLDGVFVVHKRFPDGFSYEDACLMVHSIL